MRSTLILATLVIFSGLSFADPASVPAGTIPSSDGTAGVIAPDNGMDPNPNPLATSVPLNPASNYQTPAGVSTDNPTPSGMPQGTIIINPGPSNQQNQTAPNTNDAASNTNTDTSSSTTTGATTMQIDAPATTSQPGNVSSDPSTQTSTTPSTVTQPSTTQSNNAPFVPGPAAKPSDQPMMEKCKVVDKDGNGLIKAYMADSGPNLEGDASAWIWVPHGQCANINHGDFSGVSALIRSKINPSDVNSAQTIP